MHAPTTSTMASILMVMAGVGIGRFGGGLLGRADMHVHLGGPKARLHHLPPLERVTAEMELPELALQFLEADSCIHEGAQDHVARRPRRAVKVREPHPDPL